MPPVKPWRGRIQDLRPMLATLGYIPLDDPAYVYEPKYDGIRALVSIEPQHGDAGVTLWSRLGNEKTSQFPEIARTVRQLARRVRRPLIVDGEIVALDAKGEPAGFQQLQGRIHLTANAPGSNASVALILFDILRDGDADVRDLPLAERRPILERHAAASTGPMLRLSEFVPGNGKALQERAMAHGWEGLIAKRVDSPYRTAKRSPDWVKLKLVRSQEFVIGGWTEPRGTRAYFGALLLGVNRDGALEYVGHTGTGFDERELRKLWALLKPLEIPRSPFRERPRTNQPPHWVQPKLVAEVKFTEWTDDGKLRHPTYLGLRDDVEPQAVIREPEPKRARAEARRAGTAGGKAELNFGATGKGRVELKVGAKGVGRSELKVGATGAKTRHDAPSRSADFLVDQLRDIEDRGGNGALVLPDGDRLDVTNLRKVFWPDRRLTKGDLLRYYARVAPVLLPIVSDRPLVMKRYPNGITGKAFYQQRAPSPVPPGVRVEVVEGDEEVPNRIVGGSLKTLLYMAQMAAISQDPWFSRVESPDHVDYVALDLDPPEGVPFSTVRDIARWVRDELETLGTQGFPKTSGADGLHIYIPMPPGTPYEAGLLYAQIVATIVAGKHPRVATVERTVRARGKRVYVDYLQNIRGKTLASAYSARASEFAGTSTPLTWDEIEAGVDRRDFTILTLPERIASVGDLWVGLRGAKGAKLTAVQRYAKRGK
jgi:bifunctional non-homologous end joining protein LigD